MPRKNRKMFDKIICHHIVQGINKEYIFEKDEDKEKYLELLSRYYIEFDINIIAYCIMDNHAHMLMFSNKIENISNFMQKVNSIYAMNYNKNNNRVGYVFRNRFKSVPILDKEQMYKCIKYIHMNPVKASIVKKENDYKFSSYNDYINKGRFVNEEILEFVLESSKSYIEKFNNIEYEELYTEGEKIEEIIKKFLIQENIKFYQLKENKILIQKFINYLKSKKYQYSKTELSKVLNISRATLYRWFYE